ncbi:MAG TPA: TIGR00269 family protein [Candidatus Nanoarchaeia archaeon]|nr:TIGR00269 family protein [Candidatus Nanoarchaeia archaeon]
MKITQKVESKVKQTLKRIGLSKKEKILVALSGGKDSTTVAYLLKKFGYDIEGIHIDLKLGRYSEKCLKAVVELCSILDIHLHIYDTKKEMGGSMCYIRTGIQSAFKGKGLKNCAICGVMKKWILNREARNLKFDKIATGHNLDDEAQTFLLNIFKGSPKLSANSGPITRNVADKKFVTRIKPLFYILENDIREYTKANELPVVYEKCPCALDSYRINIRKFMNTLPDKNKENIIKNFDKIYDKINKLKDLRIEYCKKCGEPSRGSVCRRCELIGLVK